MKILKFFVTALALVGLAACEPKPTPQPTPDNNEHSFRVTVSKQVIVPNGIDEAVFTATFDGEVVTEGVEIYDENGNDATLNDFTFTTDKEGDYKFLFKYTFEEKTYESIHALTYDENGFLIREGRYDQRMVDEGGYVITSPDTVKDHPGDQVADLMGKKYKPPISPSILDELYW